MKSEIVTDLPLNISGPAARWRTSLTRSHRASRATTGPRTSPAAPPSARRW
jgi:hypothetical protein